MSRLIDVGLEELVNMLVRMGQLAHQAVSLSLDSRVGDTDYRQVQYCSDNLKLMANEAEDKIFELIARFQPVASDLRILKSYIKITYDFARFGRYALDVAHIHKRVNGLTQCEIWIQKSIEEMSQKVLEMVKMSIDSLKGHDIELAKALSNLEKQVDKMYFKYLDHLVEKASSINKCTVASVLIVRYLERIADHATYICESIIYLATGEKVKLG
jgi:phosphate transport system protein